VKIIKDLGLAAIELAGVLMAVFIGVGLVSREIERRSVFALLSKPLPRWEFIVGKYCGLVLTLLVNVAGMTLAFFVVLAWLGWVSPENVRASWTAPAVDPRLLVAILEITAELALLTAIALFFSTFSSSTLLSVLLTAGVLIAGQLSQDLRQFGDVVDVSPVLATLVSAVGWVVPAFSAFDHKNAIVSGLPVEAGRVAYNLGYAVVYAAAALAASVAVFSRREFT
jgi:ABC-type transport system involved in multi-copper enzyme maturation permease subunit